MRALLPALAALALAAPAAAQINGSASGFSDAPTQASEAEYWSMLGQMGTCLAEQKTEESTAFLASNIDSSDEDAAFDALFHRSRNGCMGNFVQAGFLRSHVRGVVAEGLFEALPDATVEAFIAAPPTGPEVIASLHDFARCYVVAHPAEARALLRETRVATQGELEFIRTIAADFAPCLPQDREVRLRPTSVRMAIAEAAYHAATGGGVPIIQGAE
ncbi:hypothetical protein OZN62_02470 [Aurantiacibacter sp. MUD11]|uniref:hypothetical protein n=1 Tax=Aurantiacibacter sp. MUD11 TaxID=3003265 RepID=UPI0022AA9552|nr:hypothetical protein [Aurantiacibacter sp. MUD11]WAT18465.1 hypothetical protein OZN62_02470 [Aurantiacibacter sp. MUD11]